jgi:hypothetical protein
LSFSACHHYEGFLFSAANQDFLCAAPDTTAGAAFVKESRMNFANATKLPRKIRVNRPKSQDEQPIFRSVAVIPVQCIENVGSSVELLLRAAQN